MNRRRRILESVLRRSVRWEKMKRRRKSLRE